MSRSAARRARDLECLHCGGLPPGEASGAADVCLCGPGNYAASEGCPHDDDITFDGHWCGFCKPPFGDRWGH